MARPLKAGLAYFQHDVNMSADEKLEALEAVHGNDGYAVYNKLLERIFKSYGKLDFSDDVQCLSIARKCNVSSEKFLEIVSDCIRFRLFDRESWETKRRLTSERIRLQLEAVESEREKWRAKAGGENPARGELSPEKTPVIPGENSSCLERKVHKAEQSREENKSASAREGLLVDNSGEADEASLYAFAFERARATPKIRSPQAYARKIMHEPDVVAAWRESIKPPEPALPRPPPCACGEDYAHFPGDPDTIRRCLRCKAVLEYNDWDEAWRPAEAAVAANTS